MCYWVSRRAWWAMLATAALVIAGCGQTASPSGAAKGRARGLLISADQLPEKYRVANGQEYPGESKVCGVRLEPDDVRGFAMKRYTRSAVGPFLYQFVFVGSDAANRKLVAKVRRELEKCRKDVTETGEGTITYQVSPLPEVPSFGQGSVGLRMVPKPDGPTSEYLLVHRGDVLALFFTVTPDGIPAPRNVLLAGVRAFSGPTQ